MISDLAICLISVFVFMFMNKRLNNFIENINIMVSEIHEIKIVLDTLVGDKRIGRSNAPGPIDHLINAINENNRQIEKINNYRNHDIHEIKKAIHSIVGDKGMGLSGAPGPLHQLMNMLNEISNNTEALKDIKYDIENSETNSYDFFLLQEEVKSTNSWLENVSDSIFSLHQEITRIADSIDKITSKKAYLENDITVF